jgi:hypothetical protein
MSYNQPTKSHIFQCHAVQYLFTFTLQNFAYMFCQDQKMTFSHFWRWSHHRNAYNVWMHQELYKSNRYWVSYNEIDKTHLKVESFYSCTFGTTNSCNSKRIDWTCNLWVADKSMPRWRTGLPSWQLCASSGVLHSLKTSTFGSVLQNSL